MAKFFISSLSYYYLTTIIMASTILYVQSIDLDPIIKTTSGRLIGQKTFINNEEIYQFLGVPYAQPPINQNRFEKPLPMNVNSSNSENFLISKQFKPTCMQMKHLAKAINPLLDVDQIHNISEDCLYLNIYVPVTSNDSPLPVMVWLPGEGFDFADARQFNGAYLASIGKVIVITVQYRVGIFGFLKDNAGLWDQLTALQWIQDNAKSFGGDSNDVTLFGRFTGSMSISILLSSAKVINNPVPLFNRAILMSGIAVGNWVFDKKHNDKVKRIIESQGCHDLKCLKTISAKDILDNAGYDWKPYIDSSLIEYEPLEAIRKGKFSKHVDSIMLGSNQFEGSLCLLKHMALDEPFYSRLIENNITLDDYERIIREDLHMFYGGELHLDTYKSDIVDNRDDYLKFCSELLIDSHMREYETLLQKIYFDKQYQLQKIFKYKVDYKPSFSIAPKFINSSIHGDDVLLAFGLAFKQDHPLAQNEQDKRISHRMVELFSEFASNEYSNSDSKRIFEIKLDETTGSTSSKLNCPWNLKNYPLWTSVSIVMFMLLVILIVLSMKLISMNRYSSSSSVHIKKQLIPNC